MSTLSNLTLGTITVIELLINKHDCERSKLVTRLPTANYGALLYSIVITLL